MDRRGFIRSLFVGASALALEPLAAKAKAPAVGDGTASSRVYDVFCWHENGNMRLAVGPAWEGSAERGKAAGSELRQNRDAYVGSIDYSRNDGAERLRLYSHKARTVVAL